MVLKVKESQQGFPQNLTADPFMEVLYVGLFFCSIFFRLQLFFKVLPFSFAIQFCHFLDFSPFFRHFAFSFAIFGIPYSRFFTVLCMFPETRFNFVFGRLVSRLGTAILWIGFLKGVHDRSCGCTVFPVCCFWWCCDEFFRLADLFHKYGIRNLITFLIL